MANCAVIAGMLLFVALTLVVEQLPFLRRVLKEF